MSIAERLQRVRDQVHQAAIDAGRDPDDVTLIAVSKTHPVEAVLEAYDAGQRHFGESYAQELAAKAEQLSDRDIAWHFIGRIQTNKASRIAPVSHRVHAVHSVRHARALGKHSATPVPCLLAVNLGAEDSKTGVSALDTLDVAAAVHEEPTVRLCGLMTLPPQDEPARPYFERLAQLAEIGRGRGLPLGELSMGMTSDYRDAIACGATWVRVGTAIFGPRTR